MPPPNKPRVDEEHPPAKNWEVVRSPKSAAFPNVDIVIKSIEFIIGPAEPANIPLVDEEQLEVLSLTRVKSPKSCAFPVDAIVM